MRLYEGGYIGQHSGSGTCKAPVGRGMDGTAPSSLIEGVGKDVVGSEGREEGVVGVAMVAEAVDED